MPDSVGSIKLDTRVLDAIARELDTNTDRVLASIAFQTEGLAKTLAPIDTGALANGINTEKKSHNLYWVQDAVEYGIYQELGTYKMSAHPFMVPALGQVERQTQNMWESLF